MRAYFESQRSGRGAQIRRCIAHSGDMCPSLNYCIFLRLGGVIGDDMGILEKSGCPTRRQKSLWPRIQPLGSVMRCRVGMRSSLSLVGF